MLGALKVYARANQASIVSPFIVGGAMSPVTVAGTLTQILCEATSAIAFFSLIVSDIQPVINFGLIMIMGLFCAFFLTFTVLPSLIKVINPTINAEKD